MEVSSFMSHWIHEFQSDYSIFTNFKVDHQNWHRDMQEYLDAKMHMTQRTTYAAIVNNQVEVFARENNLKIQLPGNSRRFYQCTDSTVSSKGKYLDYTDGENIIINGRKKYRLSESQLS